MTARTKQSCRQAAPQESCVIIVAWVRTVYLVGVWESEEAMRTRFGSDQMRATLADAGFPAMDEAEITVLRLHAVEPPL
jgi:quinol monooxygenase YgiN